MSWWKKKNNDFIYKENLNNEYIIKDKDILYNYKKEYKKEYFIESEFEKILKLIFKEYPFLNLSLFQMLIREYLKNDKKQHCDLVLVSTIEIYISQIDINFYLKNKSNLDNFYEAFFKVFTSLEKVKRFYYQKTAAYTNSYKPKSYSKPKEEPSKAKKEYSSQCLMIVNDSDTKTILSGNISKMEGAFSDRRKLIVYLSFKYNVRSIPYRFRKYTSNNDYDEFEITSKDAIQVMDEVSRKISDFINKK